MVEPVKAHSNSIGLRSASQVVGLLVAAAAFSFAGAVIAEILPDPTRPSGASMNDGLGAAGAAASGPVLQSVLVSPNRRVAVINGQSVAVGDRIGEARVAKITETEVTLAQGGQMQVLRLFVQVEKKLSQTASRPQTEIRR